MTALLVFAAWCVLSVPTSLLAARLLGRASRCYPIALTRTENP